MLGKGQTGVIAGLDRIHEQLPFRLRGLHPDTGSEFINMNLFTYCKERGIVFTRSRPDHKNDNCHVEQKNWTLVRRLIGPTAGQSWLWRATIPAVPPARLVGLPKRATARFG